MGLRFEEDPNATNTRTLEAEIKEMLTSNQVTDLRVVNQKIIQQKTATK